MAIIKVDCPQCSGKGRRKYGKIMQDCRYCGGKGKVETIDQTKPNK
jgi:DnaJ-class molecular chaperone